MSVVTLAPGAASDGGGGDQSWTNVGNVLADDSSYAVCSLSAAQSSNLIAVDNFGFSIPSGATIAGIELTIVRDALGDIADDTIRVVDSTGTVQGSDKASVSAWPGSFGSATYGGLADDWSAGLDSVDINSSPFGFRIACASVFGATARVQYVEASVYYSGGASPVFPGMFVQRRRVKPQRAGLTIPYAFLGDLADVIEVETTVLPAIVAKARSRPATRRARHFIGFAPDSATVIAPSSFVPPAIFARVARHVPARRHSPRFTFAPPPGNGDVCACPFGAVLVSSRFAAAKIVSVDAAPFLPSIDGTGTDRPSLNPDATATAVVVQSSFATAQIVAVCHC